MNNFCNQNIVSKFNIDSLKGYESPIEVMFRDIENRIREQEENAITAEVSRQMCVNVDKDELMKALAYDRDQYHKGFADAERQYHKIAHWRQTEEPCHWDTIECAECSNCGHSFIVDHEYWGFDEAIREMKYCSQCGAEMSEEPEYAEEEKDDGTEID